MPLTTYGRVSEQLTFRKSFHTAAAAGVTDNSQNTTKGQVNTIGLQIAPTFGHQLQFGLLRVQEITYAPTPWRAFRSDFAIPKIASPCAQAAGAAQAAEAEFLSNEYTVDTLTRLAG